MKTGQNSGAALRAQRGTAPLVGWFVTASVILLWFLLFAPISVGGPTTYVLVDGTSMQPLLHTGDLAVARRQTSYAVGDLVVFTAERGQVIHRIVEQTPSGWKTRGDNRTDEDPWNLKSRQIMGKYSFAIPHAGAALRTVSRHYILFAGICAALALLAYVPWRRRQLVPVLASAVRDAEKEPRRDGRTNSEYAVLAVCGLGAFASLGLVTLFGIAHRLNTVAGWVSIAALVWTGIASLILIYRMYDGRGVKEPSRSMYALSGRLYLVDAFPPVDGLVQPVRSAIELRTIAEKYRLPILHRIDHVTGCHEFLLVTVQRGTFIWQPCGPAEQAAGGDGGATPAEPDAPAPKSGPLGDLVPGLSRWLEPVRKPFIAGLALATGAALGYEQSRPVTVATGATLLVVTNMTTKKSLHRGPWTVLGWIGLWLATAVAGYEFVTNLPWLVGHWRAIAMLLVLIVMVSFDGPRKIVRPERVPLAVPVVDDLHLVATGAAVPPAYNDFVSGAAGDWIFTK